MMIKGQPAGGDDGAVYQWMSQNGLPDQTCQLYEADDNDCTPINTCRTCSPDGTCSAVTNYKTYMVDEYGPVSGAVAMQQEIYARGPISCGVDASVIGESRREEERRLRSHRPARQACKGGRSCLCSAVLL